MSINRGSEWNKWDLHVHTASSYDYQYKGADADDLLCLALKTNGIRAAAITDHFKIDKERINNLQKKASDIVFFPGVELRTDKGASNLHVILIFSNQINLDELSQDFDSIMIRSKAKAKDKNETIYWTFEDIIDFADDHEALVSIHAGKKANGIDKEITNALPFNEAIKADIAEHIHFFELGQKRDIEGYEKFVFKDIIRKPLIMCSDNHDPKNYSTKENLWIKSELTFSGLKQCLYQPLERVYIGVIPPVLDRLNKNKQANIDSISVKQIDNPKYPSFHWFDTRILFNPGMTAIIGNKGTGKSALSDIIGHLCKCSTMDSASFLNPSRFRKPPQNFANDYVAQIIWADGADRELLLSDDKYETTIEDAQYLPQKFIEDICNNIDNEFQDEINKVIFSYVERSERGGAQNLNELIKYKSYTIDKAIEADINNIKKINNQIIKLEQKRTEVYKKNVLDNVNKLQEILVRHENSKPSEVKKPESKDINEDYRTKLQNLNVDIEKTKNSIEALNTKIISLNALIDDSNKIVSELELLASQFLSVKEMVNAFITKYNLDSEKAQLTLTLPKEYIIEERDKAIEEKKKYQEEITNPEHGLKIVLQKLEEQKKSLIATTDNNEKLYQKFLTDLEEWNIRREAIIGNKDTEGTLEYFKSEQEYIEQSLESDYSSCFIQRDELTKKLHKDKCEILSIYQSIYNPIQEEIRNLLGNIDNNVTFKAELFMSDPGIINNILSYIDLRMKSKLGRSQEAYQKIERLVRSTDFNDSESVLCFVHSLTEIVTEDLEQADKKISDRQGFYDLLYNLDYVGVNFKLKAGERNLNELSPGERGIVLLIFYLALSKESKPIIIDQPEDNLDNQSVYSKLVPCICKAKQKRQVIIVTHNPNIAVACDAEQIVFCEMDKNTCQIRYTTGAIENPEIMKHVVDVLEGTKPAFDLRSKKYN